MTGAAFLVAIVLLAMLDWHAIKNKKTGLGKFTGPGVMAALLLWMGLEGGAAGFIQDGRVQPLFWFGLGILLFLIGGVLLMQPQQRELPAAALFWLGQLAYLQGYGWVRWTERYFRVEALLAFMVAAAGIRVYLRIAKALNEKGERRLQFPVALFAATTIMMVSAALNSLVSSEWGFIPSYLASGGALLYFAAAIFFSTDRFVAPIGNANLQIRIFYHLGQIGMIAGATLRFAQ
jgi:uncharacterized membrane protein YhhN